ncbi:SPFH domain-containing protein [Nonomuraea sp. NPDC049714]|uniref:SPFH domain-containing protein n=1 Tax=Nonomuraea sp. NPDC049714 TaxID=3364357 RepID=UPI00378F1955
MDAIALGASLIMILLATVVIRAVITFVPRGRRLVVTRRGRAATVKGPGLAVVLPGVDSAVMTPHEPDYLDILWLAATTADGVAVSVNGLALASVRDPVGYARHHTSPVSATVTEAEEAIRRYVSRHDLAELADPSDDDLRELSATITERTGEWGVEVALIEFSRIEIRLKDDLLKWADGFAVRRAAALSARPDGSGPAAPDGATSPALPHTDSHTVPGTVSHTVPGTGTLHHRMTRGGQRLAVLARGGERTLFVYGSGAGDTPLQTIVMERDESDHLAELLHSGSVPDRLAALERRLADLAAQPR